MLHHQFFLHFLYYLGMWVCENLCDFFKLYQFLWNCTDFLQISLKLCIFPCISWLIVSQFMEITWTKPTKLPQNADSELLYSHKHNVSNWQFSAFIQVSRSISTSLVTFIFRLQFWRAFFVSCRSRCWLTTCTTTSSTFSVRLPFVMPGGLCAGSATHF